MEVPLKLLLIVCENPAQLLLAPAHAPHHVLVAGAELQVELRGRKGSPKEGEEEEREEVGHEALVVLMLVLVVVVVVVPVVWVVGLLVRVVGLLVGRWGPGDGGVWVRLKQTGRIGSLVACGPVGDWSLNQLGVSVIEVPLYSSTQRLKVVSR